MPLIGKYLSKKFAKKLTLPLAPYPASKISASEPKKKGLIKMSLETNTYNYTHYKIPYCNFTAIQIRHQN